MTIRIKIENGNISAITTDRPDVDIDVIVTTDDTDYAADPSDLMEINGEKIFPYWLKAKAFNPRHADIITGIKNFIISRT